MPARVRTAAAPSPPPPRHARRPQRLLEREPPPQGSRRAAGALRGARPGGPAGLRAPQPPAARQPALRAGACGRHCVGPATPARSPRRGCPAAAESARGLEEEQKHARDAPLAAPCCSIWGPCGSGEGGSGPRVSSPTTAASAPTMRSGASRAARAGVASAEGGGGGCGGGGRRLRVDPQPQGHPRDASARVRERGSPRHGPQHGPQSQGPARGEAGAGDRGASRRGRGRARRTLLCRLQQEQPLEREGLVVVDGEGSGEGPRSSTVCAQRRSQAPPGQRGERRRDAAPWRPLSGLNMRGEALRGAAAAAAGKLPQGLAPLACCACSPPCAPRRPAHRRVGAGAAGAPPRPRAPLRRQPPRQHGRAVRRTGCDPRRRPPRPRRGSPRPAALLPAPATAAAAARVSVRA